MMQRLTLFLIMLLTTAAFAQDLPRIAVYVTGNIGDDEKSALGTVMLSSLVNSGRYKGIERSNSFLAEIEREQVKQRSGAIDDNQISELGRQFGVKFVCIAAITPAFGSFQVSARIVDVETAEVVYIGQAFSPLRSTHDLTQASNEVIRTMFRGQVTKPEPVPVPAPAPVATQAPKPEPRSKPEPKPARTTENVMEDGRKRPDPVPKAHAEPPRPASFYTAIGLDVLGAMVLAYGLYENSGVGQDYNGKKEYDKVKSSEKNRNIAYAIGTAALLGGITIHIFF